MPKYFEVNPVLNEVNYSGSSLAIYFLFVFGWLFEQACRNLLERSS
jgi:hypothetical protein